ncbi:hypothetical protein GCM10023085_45080 [Actinomadura viridis]|uniref:Recombination endonuclease VII n=1 Tax=Actinomadura viridis TaxID=58110 RepID=A0A931GK59_9ACTN|nr:endonuclease domain-containing protein [Actinomadura viridis]MBG6089870.1 hypothetical protein [Actinomadura viridis]
MTGLYTRCGRLTQKGRPCRLGVHRLRWRDPLGWEPPQACGVHLTSEEWEEIYKIEDSYNERKAEAERIKDKEILSRPANWSGFLGSTCSAPDVSCRQTAVAWLVTMDMPDPRVCYDHLTPEERAALDSAQAAVEARLRRLAEEPDCWSWPVPEPREYASEEEACDALSAWQHGRGCAVCGDPSGLVQDHDHTTGLVRGKLCHTCNVKEGKGSTRAPFTRYRERNPASILGVKVRYWSPWTGYAEPEPTLTEEERAAEQRTLRDAVDRLTFPAFGSLPLDDRNDA